MDAIALFDPINSGEKLKITAKELGYKVIGIYSRPLTVYELQFHVKESSLREHCDAVIFSDHAATILGKLKELRFNVKAAIPGIDSGVELADKIAHALHLPGNQYNLSAARRDKGKMRQYLKLSGFSCPDFAICRTEEKVAAFVRKYPLPLVIKTPRGAATSHVYVCETKESVLEGFKKIKGKENFFGEKASAAVIESYIGGEEYIVNTFGDGKKVHATDMWVYEKLQSESFKNIYYNVISIPLTDRKRQSIKKMGIQLAEKFGILRGPSHIELKDDPVRGPTMIELAARLCGAKLPEFIQKYTNFDPYRSTIEVFAKGTVPFPKKIISKKHCAVAFCPLFKKGTITEISGIEEIQKLSSYESHVLNIKVGDILTPSTYVSTTPLFVFASNSNREKLLKDLKEAHELFQAKVH
jgi:biotin carboxylase